MRRGEKRQMDQITGLQEMRFLAQAGGDAARLAALARAMGVLAADADPDLAGWEVCLLALRRALSGPRIHAELTCPECGEGNALIFGVDDLPTTAPPVAETVANVPLRALRLSDLEAVEAAGGNRLEAVLARASDRDADWARAILAGPGAARAVEALERSLAGLDIQLATNCTECGADIVSPFDVQGFVMAERAGTARRLLDEVHMIARAYHWSEAEILSLPRDRRLAYLARIERDALQIEVRDVGL
jgi:hypothetical protein